MARVEQAARSVAGVMDVRELRAEYVGPDIVHAGLHLVVPRDLPVEEAHRIAETVRHRVHKETNGHYCVIQSNPRQSPSEPVRASAKQSGWSPNSTRPTC
jgi:divalent metal cation (Fe/Co/Zn/Cd) transporter